MRQEDLGQEITQSNEEFDPRTESTDSRELTVESRSRCQRVLIFLSQIFLSKLVC